MSNSPRAPERTIEYAIDAIQRRPLAFMKERSITYLIGFLSGYGFGLDVACPDEFPHRGLGDFRTWLRKRLRHHGRMEVEELLLAETSHQEFAAFDLFFTYWGEHIAERSLTS